MTPIFSSNRLFLATLIHTVLSLTPLVETRWKLRLNVGRENGSWMPPEWAKSGGRLMVNTEVQFDGSSITEDESLVGPRGLTRSLKVLTPVSRFVSSEGEQEIIFSDGGWQLQRVNDEPGSEALLRFWLDCPTGGVRGDTSIPESSRIFFSTGCWDDTDGLVQLTTRCLDVEDEIAKLRAEASELEVAAKGETLVKAAMSFRSRVNIYDRTEMLQRKLARLKRYIPSGPIFGTSDVKISQYGSLSLKQKKLFQTEYHILGTFVASPLEKDF